MYTVVYVCICMYMYVYVCITAKWASKRLSMKNSICKYIGVYVCICMYLLEYERMCMYT